MDAATINQILDALTIVSVVASAVFVLENLFIFFTSGDVTYKWIMYFITKRRGFLRFTADGRIRFEDAFFNPSNPKEWIMKKGGKEIPYELKKGSVFIGPGNVPFAMIADENSGAATIPIADILSQRAIGATPAHVSSIKDAAFAEGYMTCFEKQNPKGALDFITQNWMILVVLGMTAVIGFTVLYDKIYSSPAAWNNANACEQQKAILLGKLGQAGGDISSLVPNAVTTTTLHKTSNTGAQVT